MNYKIYKIKSMKKNSKNSIKKYLIRFSKNHYKIKLFFYNRIILRLIFNSKINNKNNFEYIYINKEYNLYFYLTFNNFI